MIDIKNPEDCCGCTACASICAHDAITMQPDALGFLYPFVNKDKCVSCGLCEKVCAFHENYDKSLNLSIPDAYAARHKNMGEIETSRSGAAFIAISDRILEKGGVVYGVGYTDHFRVVHKRATSKDERNEFKGSKYVQSDLRGIFLQIRKDLRDGLLVLFSGTPCQTAGLISFIGKALRENLYVVDVVCHGVPGPYIWRDYLAYLEKRQGSRITEVNFRDKHLFGWKAHKETFKFIDKEGKRSFKYLFYTSVIFRHSCSSCHYCNTVRPSDITIADYWGWERTDPGFNVDDKGVSLVLVNTEKGRRLFEYAKQDLNVLPAKLENCMQTHLYKPSDKHPKRMAFEDDYQNRGFEYVYKKYGAVSLRECLINKMRGLKRRMERLFMKRYY